jgi:hypothetical protein
MPSTYDRLILGAGSTAATYLSFFPPQPSEKVGVIGMPDPWSRRGTHRMGQPPHLLMLPLAEPQRAPAFPPHSAQTATVADDASDPPSDPFLRSNEFAAQIAFPGVKFRRARVASVTRISEGLKVSYEYAGGAKKFLHARKVVVATGPGAARDTALYDEAAPDGVFFTGDAYLDDDVADDLRDKSVMVQGGSATAAWSVEKALRSGAEHVYWIHRAQGHDGLEKRFGDAFPAGKRNDWLKQFEAQINSRLTRHLAEPISTRWTDGALEVKFKDDRLQPIRVSQFVAALGADFTADYLGDIRNDLVPIVDTEGHLHTDADCVLAYTDSRQQVLIIGAGIFRLPGKDSALYTKGNEYLPRAGRPPEGIPTIIATLATLSRYLQRSKSAWLDVNLANFADLDNHFRQGVARTFGTVLSHRTGRPLALTSRFVTDQVVGTRIMKTSPYGITIEELAELYGNIATKDARELTVMLQAFE